MFALALSCFSALWTPRAGAQRTITFNTDEQQAAAAIGQERVAPMRQALDRVKAQLERVLTGSTGSVLVTVEWAPPTAPGASADSLVSQSHTATVAIAKNKLTNQATADNEPASEISLYESLPATSVPFYYSTSTPLSASFVRIPNSLNKHLQFQPTTNQNDGTFRCRPPSATVKWQFWDKKSGAQLADHELFEAVAMHESLHLLGFASSADLPVTPTSLTAWGLFRFGDSAIPVGDAAFSTLARELRPTEEATGITALNNAARSYKLSRGTRTGGDNYQASHWRAYTRLTPSNAIGVMDPSPSGAVHQSLSRKFLTRADVEALDVMGWNANPDVVAAAAPSPIELISPAPGTQVAQGAPITFRWSATNFENYSLYIHPGTAVVEDNPVRVFYQLPAGTGSATLPCTANCGDFLDMGFAPLPPGEYVWSVTGRIPFGVEESEERRLTILGASCPADLDDGTGTGTPDGGVSIDDLVYFLGVFPAGALGADLDDGTGTGTPDGGVSIEDLIYFLTRFEAGC